MFARNADPTRSDRAETALEMLVETVEGLSTARTIDRIAEVVRSAARSISGADGVTFVLRDGDKCWYLDEDAVEPLWKGQRFPLTACIAGWAMLNGQTAIIPDIYVDPRIPLDAYRPTFVKSLVVTPVRPNDPIAAIGAYWAHQRTPTEEEVLRLQVMARATAVALENASLWRSLNDALQRRKFLIRELDHRCKNTLAAVQSIADQTLRTAATPRDFAEAFDARLAALSRAHEQLTRGDWGRARLAEIADAALAPFGGVDGVRIAVSGPAVEFSPETAVVMHMTLNELALNACKHGALAAPQGRVALGWSIETTTNPPRFSLTWTEHGGPAVGPPRAGGFGRRLLERGLSRDLGGESRLDFDPAGVRYALVAPLSSRVGPA
jgi:two-component sensor histidine kinase